MQCAVCIVQYCPLRKKNAFYVQFLHQRSEKSQIKEKKFYAKYIFMLQIITSYFKTFLAHELFFINKSIYLTNKNYVWMCD